MATVLVVDDEFGVGELFEAVLGDEGHQVLTAINGRLGLALLAQERVDLIFLDYMMPVTDGAATLRELAADPALRRIPVVMMSVLQEARVAERCSGYTAFMQKPFKVSQVKALAGRFLDSGKPGA